MNKHRKTMAQLKETDPERYARIIKEKSEHMKQLLRKELMRLRWGLPRKTNLPRVVMNKYTKQQSNCRYRAKKKGYILPKDITEGSGFRYVLFYDENTKRTRCSERFFEKCGFKLYKIERKSNKNENS